MRTRTRRTPSEAFALTALATLTVLVAPRAFATTTVDGGVANVSNSKTVWAAKNTAVGGFGAGYTAGYSGSSNGATQSADVYGSVNAELFGSSFELGGMEATANSNGTATYKVTSVGKTLVDEPDGVVSSQSLSATYSVTFAKLEESMLIVVVPVTVSVELAGNAGITFSGSVGSSSTLDSISWTATPAVSTSLAVAVALGGDAFSVGASISADIINLSVPITVGLNYYPTQNKVDYSLTGTLTLTMLDGAFQLFAKALFLEYDYQLFSWSGLTLASITIFTDSVPVASNPWLDLTGGYKATGEYSFADSAGLSDHSTYKWKVASNSAGVCATGQNNCTSYTSGVTSNPFEFKYAAVSGTVYLQFCVTPNNGTNSGTEVCSPYTATGNLLTFYKDISFSHTSDSDVITYAYNDDNVASGTCFNLPSSFNDLASSLIFNPPSGYSGILYLYKDTNCSTSNTYINSGMIAQSGSWSVTNLGNYGFNDMLSSFKVIWNDQVGADVLMNGNLTSNTAYGYYSYNSTQGYSETSSAWAFQRATDSSGSGSTTVRSGSGTASSVQSYTLTSSDTGKYLRYCVTPADSYTTGSQSCSDWTLMSTGITWYSGASQTGTAKSVAYTNGACVELSDFYLGFTPASLALVGQSSGTVTLKMYTGSKCSGTEYTRTAGAGTTHNINLSTVGIGSNLVSYEVSW